jgi:hypothetical protein
MDVSEEPQSSGFKQFPLRNFDNFVVIDNAHNISLSTTFVHKVSRLILFRLRQIFGYSGKWCSSYGTIYNSRVLLMLVRSTSARPTAWRKNPRVNSQNFMDRDCILVRSLVNDAAVSNGVYTESTRSGMSGWHWISKWNACGKKR